MPEETPTPNQTRRRRPPRGESAPKSRTDTRAGNGDSAKPKQRTPADRKLAASIAGTYQVIGGAITGIGLRFQDEGIAATGVATIEQSEGVAEAWLDLAEQNPKVRAFLIRATEASAVANLTALHMAILFPLLVHRGVIPAPVAAQFMAAQANGSGNGTDN